MTEGGAHTGGATALVGVKRRVPSHREESLGQRGGGRREHSGGERDAELREACLAAAFDSYQATAGATKAPLAGFTGEQRFFIAFAVKLGQKLALPEAERVRIW